MNLEPLHTRPSRPFPSGRTYPIWKIRGNGRACTVCGGALLTPNPVAQLCSDPVCMAVRKRRQGRKRPSRSAA